MFCLAKLDIQQHKTLCFPLTLLLNFYCLVTITIQPWMLIGSVLLGQELETPAHWGGPEALQLLSSTLCCWQRTATSSTSDWLYTLGFSGFYIFKHPQAKYMNFTRNISLISHFLLIQDYHDYKKFEMKILVGERWFPERDLSWKCNQCVPFTVSHVPEICKRW